MMKINRNNYEIYIIDYLDGQLSEAAEQKLMQFLEQNPDLKEELELIQNTSLLDSDVVFEGKNALKKNLEDEPINDENIDEWCIAAMEEDLSPAGKTKFANELETRPAFKKIFANYLKTRLEAEEIPFPGAKPWQLPNFESKPAFEDADYWIIAALENDLTLAQRNEWDKFKKQIKGIDELEKSYLETKLIPEQVLYPDKHKLRKQKSKMRYLYPLSGVAAAAALFYFFISIANINENAYKGYNKNVAQIEQQTKDGKYPNPAFINPAMKTQMMKTIKHFSEAQKENKDKIKELKPQKIKQKFATLEPVPIRQAEIESFENKKIPEPQMQTEVISADEVMEKMYAQNSQPSFNVKPENKLTLFKAAQKGVEAVNNKVGTKMDLQAQYDERGKRKKVQFSTKLFSITRTVNK